MILPSFWIASTYFGGPEVPKMRLGNNTMYIIDTPLTLVNTPFNSVTLILNKYLAHAQHVKHNITSFM